MSLRVICRAIILDQETGKVLLVRNKGASFWYAPGGGWMPEEEDLLHCIVREVEEESGISIHPVRLLYVQEFNPKDGNMHLELFWLGYPTGDTKIVARIDPHGIVEEARWFSKSEIRDIVAFPKRLKDRFWNELGAILESPNPMLEKE